MVRARPTGCEARGAQRGWVTESPGSCGQGTGRRGMRSHGQAAAWRMDFRGVKNGRMEDNIDGFLE